MHLEIIFPKPIANHPGIRLASGFMRRSVEDGKLTFYCPLTRRDPLFASDHELSQRPVRDLIRSVYVPGFLFAFYDDETDPFAKPTNVSFGEVETYDFHFNVAYRIV